MTNAHDEHDRSIPPPAGDDFAPPRQATRGRCRCRCGPPRRRGSVYVMVLGATMLITVIGIGALATSRVTTRATAAAADWQEAGMLAFSAVEQGIAKINADAALAPDTWRDAYPNGRTAFTAPIGRGTMSWSLEDEDDGSLSDDYADPLKIRGMGQVGAVRRVYSARLTTAGTGVDVLRTAFHADGGLSLGGPTIVLNGPASTNGNLNLSGGSLRGNGGSEVAGSGGSVTAPRKPMPSPGVFEIYKGKATVIDPSVAAAGSIYPSPLTAGYSPYGTPNPEGIYYLRPPDTVSVLRVMSSRIRGTLVIEAAANTTSQELELHAPTSWEPHKRDYPALLVKGFRKVRIYGSMPAFSDGSGTYPSELRGLFHLIGTDEVLLGDATYIKGCLVADGRITTSGTVAVTADPRLVTTPPLGYSRGNRVVLLPGTWKWDEPPAAE